MIHWAAEQYFGGWRGRQLYAGRLDGMRDRLLGEHAGLPEAIATLPFARFEELHAVVPGQHNYTFIPPPLAAAFAGIAPALRAPYLCALLLWHIGRFDEVFRTSGLDPEFALHYGDGFHRILDQIAADPGFAVLEKDSFLKDLWITRVVMIPAFAQVWWPWSGLSLRPLLRGGPRTWIQALRCGGRRPFFEGHTHDPMARAYWNERGWGEALRLAALALPAYPRHRGVFGTAWFYDPALKQVTPRLAFTIDLQLGRGAFALRVGSNPAAIANATATSAERRKRYQEGSYLPTDYTMAWSRKALIAAYSG